MNRYIYIIFFLLLLGATSCSTEDNEPQWITPDLFYFKCIWDGTPHCAFTDLIEYNGHYYCTFREGNNHIPKVIGDYGKIRILKSLDGDTWMSVALVEDTNYDLRDPKLTQTLDNKLMLLYGKSSLDSSGKLEFKHTGVSWGKISPQDNLEFEESHEIILSRKWLWRVVWYNDMAYGVAYSGEQSPLLVQSKDGIHFEEICDFSDIPGASEADINFSSDGKMTVIIRSATGNGYYSTSRYPYTSWQWKELNYILQSPKLIRVESELFATGRGLGGNVIYHIDTKKEKLNPLYMLPGGGGDTGYPGAIIVHDELWMSYYSTYYLISAGRTSIYFTKIPVAKLLEDARRRA